MGQANGKNQQPEQSVIATNSTATGVAATAAAPSSSTSTASSTKIRAPVPLPFGQQSIAQRCYNDALHSMFAFLSLRELLPAAHSCRGWYAAASKERPRGCYNKRAGISRPSLPGLLSSPLRHHVDAVLFWTPSSDAYHMRVEDMAAMKVLPSLTTLVGQLDGRDLCEIIQAHDGDGIRGEDDSSSEDETEANQYAHGSNSSSGGQVSHNAKRQTASQLVASSIPTQLKTLELQLLDAHHSSRTRQLLLSSLGELHSLTRLSLSFESRRGLRGRGGGGGALDDGVEFPKISFEPLVALPALTEVYIKNLRPTTAQCHVLKQLKNLRQLTMHNNKWALGSLKALCEPPHQLQCIEELHLERTTLDQHAMQLLVNLPTLTCIESGQFSPESFALLATFTHLRRLHLFVQGGPPGCLDGLSKALGSCPGLEDLFLRGAYAGQGLASETFMDDLAQAAPDITRLRMWNMNVPSLMFIQKLQQLQQLTFAYCEGVAQTTLMDTLRTPGMVPRSLRLLSMCHFVTLSDENLDRLMPPSSLLPPGCVFEYSP